MLFHLVRERTLVVAEVLLGTESGLRVCPSPATEDEGAFAEWVHGLARLPLDRILVSHGTPVLAGGSDALRSALAAWSAPASGA